MHETSIETLEQKRDGYRNAVAQLDNEIREMSAALETRRMARVATDGARQAIEVLLAEAKQPKDASGEQPKP